MVTVLIRSALVLGMLFTGVLGLFARSGAAAPFPLEYHLLYRYTASSAMHTSILKLDSLTPQHYLYRGMGAAFPTCSPDGQYLAYLWNGRLQVVSAAGQHSAALPFQGTVIDEISLSNLGDVVASLANIDNPYFVYQLFSADFAAGHLFELPMELSTVPLSPAVAPNGELVAYRIGGRQNHRVGRIAVASLGTLRERYAMRGGMSPAWSPDGTMIAFVRRVRERDQLFLKDVRIGAEVQLTFDDMAKSSPVWSPDGQHVLFIRPGSLQNGVYVIPWDGRERSVIELPERYTAPGFALESACLLTFQPTISVEPD